MAQGAGAGAAAPAAPAATGSVATMLQSFVEDLATAARSPVASLARGRGDAELARLEALERVLLQEVEDLHVRSRY